MRRIFLYRKLLLTAAAGMIALTAAFAVYQRTSVPVLSGAAKTSVSEAVSAADKTISYTDCVIDGEGISLRVPVYSFCTGRDVAPGFPLLEQYGMTAGELEAAYKRNDVYFNAVWRSSEKMITELVVYIEHDGASRSVYNMTGLDPDELTLRLDEYENYSSLPNAVAGVRYFDSSVYKTEQAVFIRAFCEVRNISGSENRLEYTTIVNGKRVIFTLIEHPDEGTQPAERISDENIKVMDGIMKSVRWDKINSAFFAKHGRLVVMAVLTLIAAIAIIAVLAIDARRKKATVEEADSEPETEIEEKTEEKTAETDDDSPEETEDTQETSEPEEEKSEE